MERADELIAKFLKSSSDLERYLHENGPLTPLQHQTVTTTIMGLQTFLQSWERKHSAAQPQAGTVTSHKAQES